MSWFENWFDTPLYEMIYANRNEEEAEMMANLIEAETPADRYPGLLDLGCGRGRHSIAFAERGYRVAGLDLSEESIRKARKKAAARGLHDLTFIHGDMRQPLNATFDVIVNLFTTFGYFLEDLENLRVIKSAERMLRKDGVFVVDYLNAPYVKAHLVSEESGTYNEIQFSITRKIENNMVYKNIQFSGEQISEEESEYMERVKLYEKEWFEEAFDQNGFELKKTYGDYRGSSYKGAESPRLILIAKKRD
ncbi:MAG: class I SAM-dependent methyltransferase [Balneolaceae bacterium]|nr:class I SAM-dependent methyltransferase [Balneolaceae bacterium]